MPRVAKVLRIPTSSPDDVSGLAAAIDAGKLSAASIVGIMGKTEGNGCVNDFTRGYSTMALAAFLSDRLGQPPKAIYEKVAMVMSGGTEGGLSPHITVFSCEEEEAGSAAAGKHLAMAAGHTRVFLPEELGRMAQVTATADAIKQAMAAAGIESAADVHFVQIKCPLLTKERVESAHARGQATVTAETYPSMAFSRGASALGVAVALGEVDAAALSDADICRNWDLFSETASTSAGIELMHNEILVLGNSPHWGGELRIAHAVMQDAIDMEAARAALSQLGISPAGQLSPSERGRVAAVLAKAEASHNGAIRGRRHIMLDDSDIQPTRHARALVGGVLAGLIGDTCLYVSGGAEHQGPDGGGPVAVIASVAE